MTRLKNMTPAQLCWNLKLDKMVMEKNVIGIVEFQIDRDEQSLEV